MMNSKVPGSILTVFSVKRKKGLYRVSRACKTQPFKNNDESNTIIASHTNSEKNAGKIGYWVSPRGSRHNLGNMSDFVGENVLENRF